MLLHIKFECMTHFDEVDEEFLFVYLARLWVQVDNVA